MLGLVVRESDGPDRIARQLTEQGIAILPSFANARTLASMNREFLHVIDEADRFGHSVDRMKGLTNVRTTPKMLIENGAEAIPSFFGNPFFLEVAQAFFQTDALRMNSEIFVNHADQELEAPDRPPFVMHFDRRQVLKFFLYLTETGEENGAMRAAPGSVAENRRSREAQVARGVPLERIENHVEESARPVISAGGPEGTLLIFTTDMSHAVGPKLKSARRVVRSHCHSHEMLRQMGWVA